MKKRQKIINVRETHLSLTTEERDFQTKLKDGRKLLTKDDRCKVSICFRGRATTYKKIGQCVLERYADECKDITTVEQKPKTDGCQTLVMLVPTAEK